VVSNDNSAFFLARCVDARPAIDRREDAVLLRVVYAGGVEHGRHAKLLGPPETWSAEFSYATATSALAVAAAGRPAIEEPIAAMTPGDVATGAAERGGRPPDYRATNISRPAPVDRQCVLLRARRAADGQSRRLHVRRLHAGEVLGEHSALGQRKRQLVRVRRTG